MKDWKQNSSALKKKKKKFKQGYPSPLIIDKYVLKLHLRETYVFSLSLRGYSYHVIEM